MLLRNRGGQPREPISEAALAELEIEPALLSVVCRELNNKRRRAGRERVTAADLSGGAQNEIVAEFYRDSFGGMDPAVKVFIEDELVTEEGKRDTRPLAALLASPASRPARFIASSIVGSYGLRDASAQNG